MRAEQLLVQAREQAGMSQSSLAEAAGTSRSTLSAYERGRKSPTLATAARIVAATGNRLAVTADIEFRQVIVSGGRPIAVPLVLPRLAVDRALRSVRLPVHLNWSDRGLLFDLNDRRQRARVYEIVLREGGAEDILEYIDGALLADLWDELVLPDGIRAVWEPLLPGVDAAA